MKSTLPLAMLLLLSTATHAHAALLFSTDLGTDELVRIDSATGSVTVIGSLVFDAKDVDLVSVGSRLFAINSDFEVHVDLHEIDPTTGAAISSVQVHTASRIVKLAEGLAHVGGQLKIGFRDDDFPPPFSHLSNRLGDLGTDGLITNIKSGGAFLDFDALGVNASTGQLYGSDGNPFGRPGDTDFYTVTESPFSVSVFHTTFAASGLAFSDLVVDGNTLFAIEFNTPAIYLFDLSTNSALPIAPLDRAGTYGGLALAQARMIVIDIKPGGFPNSINPSSKGKIPVAILTTDATDNTTTFDATTVDPTTVRFGSTGTEAAPVQDALEDVDGDGDTDMVLHFNTQETGIQCGDTSATLTGESFGGQGIQGTDSIETVGCK